MDLGDGLDLATMGFVGQVHDDLFLAVKGQRNLLDVLHHVFGIDVHRSIKRGATSKRSVLVELDLNK